MVLLGNRIRDGRGLVFRITRLPIGGLRERSRDLVHRGWRVLLTCAWFVAGAICYVDWQIWLDEALPHGRVGDAVLILGLMSYPLALVVPVVVADRCFWRDVVRRRIAARLCGACVYPIGGLPPQDDGLVVCPECGAAWRLGSGA